GERLSQALTERLGNHRHVGDIRGRGLFWAIVMVQDRATKAVFDPALKLNDRIKQQAFQRGLAIYPMGATIDGRNGDHVLVAPRWPPAGGPVGTRRRVSPRWWPVRAARGPTPAPRPATTPPAAR